MDAAPAADNNCAAMRPSFKVKLAVYFLLLAVLPLCGAFWAFAAVTTRAEEQRVDARLGAELRAAVAAYGRELRRAEGRATRLARDARIQRALATGNHRVVVGDRASLVATRVVNVRRNGRLLGSIVATVALDDGLLRRLRSVAGLADSDRLQFVRSRSGTGELRGIEATLSGSSYRALTSGPLRGQPRAELAVLAPTAAIASETATMHRRLLYVLFGGLLVLAAIAAAEGRSVMRSLGELARAARAIGGGDLDRRVPVRGRDEVAQLAEAFNAMAAQLRQRLAELEVQRTQLRESLNRIGELLASTHDVDQLLPVIAAAARETAGAQGVLLLGENGTVVEEGRLDEDGQRVELPLAVGDSRFGIIVLVSASFDEDGLAAARSLAAQAAVALENARLHEALELQAITDSLTGLANRRRCEEFLATEIARSERYETPLALVLCDVDAFKAANDAHGHAFGDDVLCEFGALLRDMLRDIDLAGRWGGEEFMLALPGTDLDGAVDAAERIRRAFAARPFATPAGGEATITASFGVAEFGRGMSVDALVAAADEALYAAKRNGRNRVEVAAGDAVAGQLL